MGKREDGKKGRLKKDFRRIILQKLIDLQEIIAIKIITEEEINKSLEILNSKTYGEYS